jgi:hypothetical protein
LINVNTAPVPLLEAALRAGGRSGLEQILQARAAHRRFQPGRLDQGATPANASGAPELVSSSPSWAFRIDAHAGPVRRSWWAVYQRSSSSWECVQRLTIDD